MAAPCLNLDPDECSAVGLLILNHIEEHRLTFTAMAKQVSISRAALREICLGKVSPSKSTASRLAKVLNQDERGICQCVFQNKLLQLYGNSDSYNPTVKALEKLVECWEYRLKETNTEKRQLTDFDLYSCAFKRVTDFPKRK